MAERHLCKGPTAIRVFPFAGSGSQDRAGTVMKALASRTRSARKAGPTDPAGRGFRLVCGRFAVGSVVVPPCLALAAPTVGARKTGKKR